MKRYISSFPLSASLKISPEERATREALIRALEGAFQETPPVKKTISPQSPFMWRGFDTIDPYHGRWQDFPLKKLWDCTDALYYVPPEGLVFFLPAVLCLYLSQPEEIPQTTLEALSSTLTDSHRLDDLLARLSQPQRRALCDVAEFIAAEGPISGVGQTLWRWKAWLA